MKLASLKTIFRNNKKIDVIANNLDDNSVYTVNVVDKAITTGKLSEELQTLLSNTMVQKFCSTEPADNRTYSDSKYNPQIGDIYIETTSYGSVNKISIRTGLSGIDTLWTCIWSDQDPYISGYSIFDKTIGTTKLSDKAVTTEKLSEELQSLLSDTMVQKFYGTEEPDNRTYSDSKYNPQIGDIYIEKTGYGSTNKIYIRTGLSGIDTLWNCIWSDFDAHFDGSKIVDNTVAKNKLSKDLQNLLNNTMGQVFYGTDEPTIESYVESKYNPRLGDIYIKCTDQSADKIYIRAGLVVDGSTLWVCIWSDFDANFDGSKIIDNTVAKNKLSKDLQELLNDTMCQVFYGTQKPNISTYAESKYNPRIGDIYVMKDGYSNAERLYVRMSYNAGDSNNSPSTIWRCMWTRQIDYDDTGFIHGDSISTKTINRYHLTDDLISHLSDTKIQRFTGYTEPNSLSYIDNSYNPRIGDIYIHIDQTDEYNIGFNSVYVRSALIKDSTGKVTQTDWVCIWSNSEYINGHSVYDSTISGYKLIDNTITENKLDTNLTSLLLKGTYGTDPMNEGDFLNAGQIYIQYDENN